VIAGAIDVKNMKKMLAVVFAYETIPSLRRARILRPGIRVFDAGRLAFQPSVQSET